MKAVLVNYSSSSDDEDEEKFQISVEEKVNLESSKKRKLPLPESLVKKSRSTEEDNEYDDPEFHEGRQRAVCHERGNWATFIYIQIPETANDLLEEIQDKLIEFCNKEHGLTLNKTKSFHISLTKLLILRHHWIDSFIESIRCEINSQQSFNYTLNEIEIYSNDEKTRTFLGIKTSFSTSMLELIAKLDKSLDEFKLPKYYTNPSFHVSILWALNNKVDCLMKIKKNLQNILDNILELNERSLVFHVNELYGKCGNRNYKFLLR